MDSVLEEATVLGVCKLACSLPFLPSLSSSSVSPVSFCCCCLLIFTDVVLTVFFSVLWVLERWQAELTSTGDAIALRCLLFISHSYGAVFLLTLPAIAVDVLIRLVQHRDSNRHHPDKLNEDKISDAGREEPVLGYHVLGYLTCLSLWVFGTLRIKWRWKLEEVWTAACLYSTNSLLTCLPKMNSPMLRLFTPCWAMALLSLTLVIYLAIVTGPMTKRRATITQLTRTDVDPGRAENSCKVQMSNLKDLGLSPGLLKSEKNGQDHNPLTLTLGRQQEEPQSGCGRVFLCPGADVMIGVMCALAFFVLPLNLSVNIPLISSLEKVLGLGVRYVCLSKSIMAYNDMELV